MKKKILVLLCSLSVLAVCKANAAEFGKATMGGFGCPKVEIPQIGLGNNVLALKIDIEKPDTQELARAACNVRVPVKLKKDEMLKIVSGGVDYDVQFDKGSANISLYAGLGGKKDNTANVIIVESDRSTLNIPKNESACGKDMMLKINLNASVAGKTKGSIKTQDLKFELKTSKCN